jgi:DNA polymerase-3 subunit delta
MAQKKAQSKEYADLKKAVASKMLGQLYILYGEEVYLKEYYLSQMKKAVLGQDGADFNLKRFDGSRLDLSDLIDAVEALPSFAERTFVEVRDYDLYKLDGETSARLISVLSDIPDYCCLTFVYDLIEYKPDKRLKIHSVIEKQGHAVEISAQESNDLINWIKRRFAHNGLSISREDAEYLIFYCGDLMTGLVSEIEKISSFCGSGTVKRKDIETVAIPVLDAVAFHLINAISKNDYETAALIMAQLFEMRENPIKLLNMLGGQMRKLYAARLVYESGKDACCLKNLLDLRSDYQVRLLMEAAPLFSADWCADAVVSCAETDLKMKSSSLDDNELLVDLLLLLAGHRAL